MNIIFSDLAHREYREIILWYKKISDALAEAFIVEFEDLIEILPANPEIGNATKGEFRRLIMRRFPYCIYYALQPETVVIISIYHLSRKSPYWLT